MLTVFGHGGVSLQLATIELLQLGPFRQYLTRNDNLLIS